MLYLFPLQFLLLFTSFLSGTHQTSKKNASQPLTTENQYATKNVIVVVIDGVRYSDSWGDTTLSNVPRMAKELAPQGVFYPAFYNQGVTLTNPGHVALTTGHHQRVKNDGSELPDYPSIFHYYRAQTGAPASHAWIITSKDKLEILARSKNQDAVTRFAPSVNCGVNGLGTGYRDDTTTLRVARQVLTKHKPKLVLLNLREPDSEAHAGNWTGYVNAIKQSDRLVSDLWKWLQKQPQYRNSTTLFITNDHGRHTGKRFQDHGDKCEGCRHISLLALGPDVKAGTRASQMRSQVDVAATTAELLGFTVPKIEGEPMWELFKTSPQNMD